MLGHSKFLIFDLDQTLVDTSSVEALRVARRWGEVMKRAAVFPVYEGISDLLKEMHASGIRLAIVTKSPDMVARALVKLHQWPIDIVVGYHQVQRRKPDPEGLAAAMKQAEATSEQTYHIGDKSEDTLASRAAGIGALGAAWGLTDTTELIASKPDRLFSSVAELRTFLISTL